MVTETTKNTISWDSIRDRWLSDPLVKAEYDALAPEFTFARQVIALRKSKRQPKIQPLLIPDNSLIDT